MINEIEIWKKVKKFPKYQVSNFGRVKSFQKNKETILRGHKFNNKYQQVWISNKKECHNIFVHILVLRHFKRKQLGKDYSLHLNGLTLDNHEENLRWANKGDIYRFWYRHKKKQRGVYEVKIGNMYYWVAKLKINKKLKTIGYSPSKQIAELLYQNKYKEVYGINPY